MKTYGYGVFTKSNFADPARSLKIERSQREITWRLYFQKGSHSNLNETCGKPNKNLKYVSFKIIENIHLPFNSRLSMVWLGWKQGAGYLFLSTFEQLNIIENI